jgi:hypothetical protein
MDYLYGDADRMRGIDASLPFMPEETMFVHKRMFTEEYGELNSPYSSSLDRVIREFSSPSSSVDESAPAAAVTTDNEEEAEGDCSSCHDPDKLHYCRSKCDLKHRLKGIHCGSELPPPPTVVQSDECCVCLANRKDTVLLPCKHLCVCSVCAVEIKDSSKNNTCPICRAAIKDTMKVFY